MAVTAIIPTWNRKQLVCQVIADLQAQIRPADVICVVDNGSDDGTAEACEGVGAAVIRMGRNAGFAAAVNRGIAAASTEWVAVLNNDVRLDAEWLERLLAGAAQAGAAYAGCKILSEANHTLLDGSFDLLCRGGCAWRAGQGRADGGVWNQSRSIHFVPFTAAIFRRELFLEVGGLDESLESYLEDVEFGLRCALAGKHGVYVPTAVAHHQGSATYGVWSAKMVRLISRNQVLLMAKHGGLKTNRWASFVAHALWGLVALRHGAGLAWWQGKREGLKLAKSRTNLPAPKLDAVLRQSESELRRLQEETGFDWYWRIYFSLT